MSEHADVIAMMAATLMAGGRFSVPEASDAAIRLYEHTQKRIAAVEQEKRRRLTLSPAFALTPEPTEARV